MCKVATQADPRVRASRVPGVQEYAGILLTMGQLVKRMTAFLDKNRDGNTATCRALDVLARRPMEHGGVEYGTDGIDIWAVIENMTAAKWTLDTAHQLLESELPTCFFPELNQLSAA